VVSSSGLDVAAAIQTTGGPLITVFFLVLFAITVVISVLNYA
jgi:hypothetical protein